MQIPSHPNVIFTATEAEIRGCGIQVFHVHVASDRLKQFIDQTHRPEFTSSKVG